MSKFMLPKVTIQKAADLRPVLELGDEAGALMRDDFSVADYLELLMDKQQYPDAVRLLAHALPKREAIGWVYLCARKASAGNPDPNINAALQATERWIREPTDENRREAMARGEAAKFSTPAGCAALAVFWSGGSLGPPNVPPIPPGEFLTAKAVSGGIVLAAVQKEPEKAPVKYQEFLAQGIKLAQ